MASLKAEDIKTVACVGAGTIGSSWPTLFALRGCRVKLCDVSDETLQRGLQSIEANFESLMQSGVVGPIEARAALSRITATTDLGDAVKGADFVQESGPERYGAKMTLFARIDALASSDVVISSNSSGLLMTEIQKATRYPNRCIVSHPFNPPHIIPLVQIVPGERTSDETVRLDKEFMVRLGKVPVVLRKEIYEYVVNRLQGAIFREALYLVGQGVVSAPELDTIFRMGPGLRFALIGPFTIASLASGGGLEELLNGKYSADYPYSEAVPEPGTETASSEEWTAWQAKALAEVKEELAGRDMDELRKWRDARLLDLVHLLGYSRKGGAEEQRSYTV